MYRVRIVLHWREDYDGTVTNKSVPKFYIAAPTEDAAYEIASKIAGVMDCHFYYLNVAKV